MRYLIPTDGPVRGAVLGLIISLGAPSGWIGIQFLKLGSDVSIAGLIGVLQGLDMLLMAYITFGTSTAFTLFGWMLGQRGARLVNANLRLNEMAITDELTGLLNPDF